MKKNDKPRDERPRSGLAAHEMKYYGWQACQRLAAVRRTDIIRVYIQKERVKEAGELLKWCAQQKKAYHLVTREELSAWAGTEHHEGIGLLALVREPLPVERALALWSQELKPIVLLDGVGNPHNVGAIIRSAAHFGITRLGIGLRGGEAGSWRLSAASYRVAEGGAEAMDVCVSPHLAELITRLRPAGYRLITTSSHHGQSIFTASMAKPSLFVFGAEQHGVDPALTTMADLHVNIPGTGLVESLNVSVAAALVFGQYWAKQTDH